MPQHPVRITDPFYIGVYEVTRAEWSAVMRTDRWVRFVNFSSKEQPATGVDWGDAGRFCRVLTERERDAGLLKEDESYRLPTEAEWEYACRAGSRTLYCFGDSAAFLGKYAWFATNTREIGERYQHEVGRKRPNAWGLYDFHGNVSEWCSDYLQPPNVLRSSAYRSLRGGSWDSDATSCSSAAIAWAPPKMVGSRIGFRVVRSQVLDK